MLRALAAAYKVVADATGCSFLDAGKYVKPSAIDGVHMDAAGHRALATEVKKIVELPPLKTSA